MKAVPPVEHLAGLLRHGVAYERIPAGHTHIGGMDSCRVHRRLAPSLRAYTLLRS